MNVAIFYDAAPAAGDPGLLEAAKGWLLELAAADKAFCARFAKAIESFDVPLGIFSSIIVERGEHKDQLDLKKGGIFPIVHGVRALALEHRLTADQHHRADRSAQGAAGCSIRSSRRTWPRLTTSCSACACRRGSPSCSSSSRSTTSSGPSISTSSSATCSRTRWRSSISFRDLVRYHFHLKMF